MNTKRIIAAVLSLSMAAGITACTKSQKAGEDIEKVIDKYEDALKKFDVDKALKLTSFEEGDDGYSYVEECFNLIGNGEYIIEVYRAAAATIRIDYEDKDVTISKDHAEVNVEYELVDWDPLYNVVVSNTAADLCNFIKDSEDTIKIDGRIELELVDDEWVITKITNLDQVLAFTDEFPPNITTPQWPTRPYTETEETEPVKDVNLSELAAEYISIMDPNYKDAILRYEELYDTHSCGLHDLDRDGIPELYFMLCLDDEDSTVGMMIFGFDEISGDVRCSYMFADLTTKNENADRYLIYPTIYGEMVITQVYGDDNTVVTVTTVMGDDGSSNAVMYEYKCFEICDPDTGEYEYRYYFEDEEIEEASYNDAIRYLVVSDVAVVIACNYEISEDDVMHPITSIYTVDMYSYDEIIDILNSTT